MSFLTNLSQWKKLDIKNEKINPSKMKFPTVKHKIGIKRLFRYSLILSINGQRLLQQKKMTQIKAESSQFVIRNLKM